jgi:uncharacterized protein (TIGR02118 family)
MIRLSVLYPATPGSRFDWDYYLTKHMPLVRQLLSPLGMVSEQVDRGLGGLMPGSAAPYHAVAHFVFNTVQDLQTAMGAAALQLMADVPNYTDVQVVGQISEIL